MRKRRPSFSIARPNFFVLGAAKCGTTTLHGLLAAHPHIFVTKENELKFFDDDTYYARERIREEFMRLSLPRMSDSGHHKFR